MVGRSSQLARAADRENAGRNVLPAAGDKDSGRARFAAVPSEFKSVVRHDWKPCSFRLLASRVQSPELASHKNSAIGTRIAVSFANAASENQTAVTPERRRTYASKAQKISPAAGKS